MKHCHQCHGTYSELFLSSLAFNPSDRLFSAHDMGTYLCYADSFGPLEVLASSSLVSPVAVIPITSKRLPGKDLWVIQTFDHVRRYLLFYGTWLKSDTER